jgi:hypothetical protein
MIRQSRLVPDLAYPGMYSPCPKGSRLAIAPATPGNDTSREIIAFALPASAAKAARDVCEKEFFSLSHLCRTALFNDLKARGFDCNDFSSRQAKYST